VTGNENSVNAENDAAAAPAAPFLKVVKGDPTPQELAALVGVLTAAGGNGGTPEKGPRNQWGNPVDKLRPATGLSPDMFYNLRFDY